MGHTTLPAFHALLCLPEVIKCDLLDVEHGSQGRKAGPEVQWAVALPPWPQHGPSLADNF